MSKKTSRTLITGALLMALASPALATEAGDWSFSVGVHASTRLPTTAPWPMARSKSMSPATGNPPLPRSTSSARTSGLEVLASLPFDHDISLNGVEAGSTKHLPPTFTLQYHFDGEKVSPFIGAGINYTLFFDQDTTGPLEGAELDLGNSWGLTARAGLDFKLSDNQAIRVDVRWMDIDTDVSVNGDDVGTVDIDPIVYGIAYVWNF